MRTVPSPRKVYYSEVMFVNPEYIEVDLKLGFGNFWSAKVELVGFDEFSKEAINWLSLNLLQKECVVELFQFNYMNGRYKANLYYDDQFINQRLVDMGFGEPVVST